MPTKRLFWADSLKGWLIILVVIGHAIQDSLIDGYYDNHLWNIIYSFHMPAFVAISGWLACKNVDLCHKWGQICKRRFLQLIVPYFVWSLFLYVFSFEHTWENVLKMILYPDTYYWFLWVLFWICSICTGVQAFSRKVHVDETISLIIVCLCLTALMVLAEIRIIGFQFLSYYFLFYTLGYLIHKYNVEVENKYLLITLVFVWFALAWFWKMHDLPNWMPIIPHVPSSLLQYCYRGVTAFIAILIVLGMSPLMLNGRGKFNSMIAMFGKYSLGIYVIHMAIIKYIICSVNKIDILGNIWLRISIIAIVTFSLSFLLIELIKRNRWTAQILLGKLQ